MKNILMLRHAKSLHVDPNLKDFDRPLAPRGKKDALQMGAFLKEIGMMPGAVISSTAKRARQTTELFRDGAELEKQTIIWDENLYYGSSADYLVAIQKRSDETNTVLLVGHNPKIENIARRLCGNGSIRMPTAALVCMECSAREWNRVRESQASLSWLMIPKVLKKIGGG